MIKNILAFLFALGIFISSFSQGSISGIVYADANQNGVYDMEMALSGVKVDLYASSDILVSSTYSTSSMMIGAPNYSFSNIPYGQYYVKFTALTNYIFSSTDLILQNSSTPATGKSSFIFIMSTTPVTQNAGSYYYAPVVPPTVQASNLTVSNVAAKTLTLSWTRGNGVGVIVIGRLTSSISVSPSDNHFYGGFYGFGLGDNLGNGNYVLYNGTGTSVGITDLQQLSQYTFTAYEYNGTISAPVHSFTNPSTATATTLEFSSGKAGLALSFNGTNNCLDQISSSDCNGSTASGAAEFINNTGVFTIEMWLKLNNYSADACQAIFTNGEGATYKGVLFAYDNRSSMGRSNQLLCELYNGSGTKIISSLSPAHVITDNEWHHIAFTGDGTNVRFYVDGVEYLGSGTMGAKSSGLWTHHYGYFGVCPITACIGGDISYQYWLNGVVDELKFWNITRSLHDIKNNMNLILTGDESGLKGYLQFNEGTAGASATFVPDLLQHFEGVGQGGYQPTYVTSQAPVGKGTSYTLTVPSAGTYDFTGTGVKMTFASGGTYPNGELVVSRLTEVPVYLPDGPTSFANNYWVIRNYGSNASFSPIQSLEFQSVGTIPTVSASDPTNKIHLYKRASNASGATWADFGGASSANSTSQSVVFNSSNNITSFSQAVVGFGNGILPITLVDFFASANGTSVKTNWMTSDEREVESFDVTLISTKDSSQRIVKSIKARNQVYNSYEISFNDLTPGQYLVTLRIHESGKVSNGPAKIVNVGEHTTSFVSPPHPVPSHEQDVTFSYYSGNTNFVWAEVLSLDGIIILTLCNGESVHGTKEFIIPSNILKAGIYWLRIRDQENVFVERIIIE